MGTILRIADAVTAEINRANLFPDFTAERLFIPEYDLKTLKSIKVSVVPKAIKEINIARTMESKEIQIDIGIQQKITDERYLEILLNLVEEIADLFTQKRLADVPEALCIRTENNPVYDPEHLRQMRQFTSVITLTFKVL